MESAIAVATPVTESSSNHDMKSTQRSIQNIRKSQDFIRDSETQNSTYKRYYSIKLEDTECRKINPYDVAREIEKVTGDKPESIECAGKSAYVIKLKHRKQAEKISLLSNIKGKTCQVSVHDRLNTCRGLIYLSEFDIEDLPMFKADLKEHYDVENVEQAHFIRTKTDGTSAYILTFNRERTPYSIYIPGERSDTSVTPFKNRPMLCRQCYAYGHTKKRCTAEKPICRKCTCVGYEENQCTSDTTKCYHCQGDHPAGHRTCQRRLYEQEVIDTC